MAKNSIVKQPLSPSLKEQKGSLSISTECLIKMADDHKFNLEWLDNQHLVYAVTDFEEAAGAKIEILNIHTGTRRFLTKGHMPKPSPDGQWIAYIDNLDDKKQLFLINSNGSNNKQITQLINGLTGFEKFSYDFIWSPDSSCLALHHKPYVPY